MRKKLIVYQEDNNDCGAASLLSIIHYYGGDISLDKLKYLTKVNKDGTNFYNIGLAAESIGFETESYYIDNASKLSEIKPPYIVQIKEEKYYHFSVVYKISKNKVTIMNPLKGKIEFDMFDFLNIWTGYVMTFNVKNTIINYRCKKNVNNLLLSSFQNNIKLISLINVLSMIYIILNFSLNLYSKIIFDKIINTTINNLIVITLFFSILLINKNITVLFRNQVIIIFNQKLNLNFITKTYERIILLPYFFYKSKSTGEIMSRINDLSEIKNFISELAATFFLDITIYIFTIIILYLLNQKIAFIVFIFSLLYILLVMFFQKIIKKNISINQKNNDIMNTFYIETISGYESIKNQNIEENVVEKFSNIYSKVLSEFYNTEKNQNIIFFIKNLIEGFLILLINFYLFKLIMDNVITIGTYSSILLLIENFIYPIGNITNMYYKYQFVKNSIRRGNDILEFDIENFSNKDNLKINGNILIKKLNFSYDNVNFILKDINISIKDKDRVLILGESGSGKSTLMKILYKYYQIKRGSIYINDIDINDYSIFEIRKDILYISQNEKIFRGNIRDNIIMNRNISKIEFLSICKIIGIEKIINNNMQGYDYFISENGSNLSGGEKQRIILARGLLKKSNLIIIDEGLSEIDVKSEREILNNIFSYYYDKTFIIISHRKSNYDLYKKIVKFSNGQINQIEEINEKF